MQPFGFAAQCQPNACSDWLVYCKLTQTCRRSELMCNNLQAAESEAAQHGIIPKYAFPAAVYSAGLQAVHESLYWQTLWYRTG